ncbi:putative MFS family arabinose efflux permease [Geothermobacter ehrlichii]|uniref:Putative MFS family arabinose efflux permease n=2 Tax=Geothermobacter ehrlichii TaxID=213224 RepID=A0A5D3WIW2_9BACT|nr:putative MFS family arabinose efflux permease [Geothermobacter ehrlichii]
MFYLRLFLPFGFGYFLSYLYRTVNAVIAPDLARDLVLLPASLGFLTSAYFLTFALSQLPLGILLDRFGPRRVESLLLLVAALGALVFARAQSLEWLVVGRGLIGIGVSACLMAAFKAFVLWFPAERLPLANGVQMVSGGLGALAATVPVEMALGMTDWRGVFLLLAGLTLLAAVILWLVIPEVKRPARSDTLAGQLRGLGQVFTSAAFWRLTPWTVAGQAAYLSLYGLWSGPWLRDVGLFDRAGVARVLLLVAVMMVLGYFTFGVLAERLARRGIGPQTTAAAGMSGFALVQFGLLFAGPASAVWLWLLFGFFGTTCILPYAVLGQSFPPSLSGRATTALNLLVFVGAFAAQWAVGWMVGLWPVTATGGYRPAGYRLGFGVLLGLQLLAALWFLAAGRRRG